MRKRREWRRRSPRATTAMGIAELDVQHTVVHSYASRRRDSNDHASLNTHGIPSTNLPTQCQVRGKRGPDVLERRIQVNSTHGHKSFVVRVRSQRATGANYAKPSERGTDGAPVAVVPSRCGPHTSSTTRMVKP